MVRRENQPPATRKGHCELTGSITFEGVRISRDQFSDPTGSFQIAQACPQFARTSHAELPLGYALLFAELADFLATKRDFHNSTNLSDFT